MGLLNGSWFVQGVTWFLWRRNLVNTGMGELLCGSETIALLKAVINQFTCIIITKLQTSFRQSKDSGFIVSPDPFVCGGARVV